MSLSTLTRSLFAFVTLLLLSITSVASAQSKPPSAEARAARDDIARTLGFVPGFFKVTADSALPGVWEEMKGLQLNPKTVLSGKVKELIGLAVASQVPCRYCVYAHVEFARLNGATDGELAEAVAVAGSERHWSAFLFGSQIDETRFRSEISRLVQNAKATRKITPIAITDARTALLDVEQRLGFVPEFIRRVPDSALPGAWRELRDLKLNPKTEIPNKYKSLIALAVASQVPSRPCVFAETEFAKLGGATEAEIQEAVGMAAITRNMSTLLNGQQIDENGFRADIDRLVSSVKAAQRKVSLRTAAPKPAH
jgi:AhpD family alkylhydroperoxidase